MELDQYPSASGTDCLSRSEPLTSSLAESASRVLMVICWTCHVRKLLNAICISQTPHTLPSLADYVYVEMCAGGQRGGGHGDLFLQCSAPDAPGQHRPLPRHRLLLPLPRHAPVYPAGAMHHCQRSHDMSCPASFLRLPALADLVSLSFGQG